MRPRRWIDLKAQSTRACPLCGSRDVSLLFHQSFAALSGRGLVDSYDVVSCRVCGFGFADGLPSLSDFERYYAEMSKYENQRTGGHTSGPDQNRCRSIAQRVDALIDDRGLPVLDVGCATGALLSAFKEIGYTDLEGLDPAPACASVAREAHGVVVRTGSTSDLPHLSRPYGLVLLSAVLEHLLDPLIVLRDAWRSLRDGGLVFVEVPDAQSFAGGAKVPYQEFSVEHINFFSLQSLSGMFGVAGFTCVHAARVEMPWTSGATAGVVHAVFRRSHETSDMVTDQVTHEALLEYISVSALAEESVRARIDVLAQLGQPVLVWGVGTYTRHLLDAGALDGL